MEKKHLYNLFLFSLLNILFLSHLLNFSFAETRLHPWGGSSVFFRGAVGRRPVSLAEELHEGGDGSIGERDTLPDEFCAHRVSQGEFEICLYVEKSTIGVCVCVCVTSAGIRTRERRTSDR